MNNSAQQRRLLILLKLDAWRLYQRLQLRAPEYMLIFSLRRTRQHFKEIFFSRYQEVTISELSLLNEELLFALDEFYTVVDKLQWYLFYTEDMPKTVEDHLYRQLTKLEKLYFHLEALLEEVLADGENSHADSNTDPVIEYVDSSPESISSGLELPALDDGNQEDVEEYSSEEENE